MSKNLYDVTHLFVENDIQELLNNKGQIGLFNDNSCNFFGLPNEFLNATVRTKQESFPVKYQNELYYNYKPDCICDDDNYVYIIELKRADKYEPLGIPEVIHHVAHQRNLNENKGKTVIPVLISSFNMWNRTVVKELKDKCNYPIRYYEIYILSEQKEFSRRVKKISKNYIIWLYEPLNDENITGSDFAEVKKNNQTLTYQCNNNLEVYTLK